MKSKKCEADSCVTSSTFDLNIFLIALFSCTLLGLRDQVSHSCTCSSVNMVQLKCIAKYAFLELRGPCIGPPICCYESRSVAMWEQRIPAGGSASFVRQGAGNTSSGLAVPCSPVAV
jgi:hypothetical protein